LRYSIISPRYKVQKVTTLPKRASSSTEKLGAWLRFAS
ncbi:hypothetical protein T12_15494, partial [Trichinella patagoniensis]